MHKEQTLLWEMLSELSTEQLDTRLALELEKEYPEEDAVHTILAVLREREKNSPIEVTPQIQTAWEKYQKDTAVIPKENHSHVPAWFIRAASVGIVVFLLFTMIPTNAQADNFWDRIARWTDEFFELFHSHTTEVLPEPYVFMTNNSGLQQIYNAVAELEISDPVVPMWVPEQYTLEECRVYDEFEYEIIHAKLSDGISEMLIEVRKYDSIFPGQYEKDGTELTLFEYQGIVHYVMYNKSRWNVVWTNKNIECFLTIDCQEDILHNILKSIYVKE